MLVHPESMGIINMSQYDSYPLVNSHIAMENHHFLWVGKSTISMAIFNSYVSTILWVGKSIISMAIFNSYVSTILWVGKSMISIAIFNSYVSTILWVGKSTISMAIFNSYVINDFYGHFQ